MEHALAAISLASDILAMAAAVTSLIDAAFRYRDKRDNNRSRSRHKTTLTRASQASVNNRRRLPHLPLGTPTDR